MQLTSQVSKTLFELASQGRYGLKLPPLPPRRLSAEEFAEIAKQLPADIAAEIEVDAGTQACDTMDEARWLEQWVEAWNPVYGPERPEDEVFARWRTVNRAAWSFADSDTWRQLGLDYDTGIWLDDRSAAFDPLSWKKRYNDRVYPDTPVRCRSCGLTLLRLFATKRRQRRGVTYRWLPARRPDGSIRFTVQVRCKCGACPALDVERRLAESIHCPDQPIIV